MGGVSGLAALAAFSWLVCIAVGTGVGYVRGSTAFGFLFPFVFGPLGLAVVFVALSGRDAAP